jgi:hypothetical protein
VSTPGTASDAAGPAGAGLDAPDDAGLEYPPPLVENEEDEEDPEPLDPSTPPPAAAYDGTAAWPVVVGVVASAPVIVAPAADGTAVVRKPLPRMAAPAAEVDGVAGRWFGRTSSSTTIVATVKTIGR